MEFTNTYIPKDSNGFATVNGVVGQHANYLWFNSIQNYDRIRISTCGHFVHEKCHDFDKCPYCREPFNVVY